MTSEPLTSKDNSTTMSDAKVQEDFKPTLADNFMQKFFRQKKKLLIRTWISTSGIETMVEEKEVKIGTLDIPLASGTYTIDYSKVQNVAGQLVYNTRYRVANGALTFINHSKHDVDAKLRKQMSARDNLHAIWSRWQLPFIACIIAMGVAIVALSLMGIFIAQLNQANACLQNENCMVSKIATIRAQAEARAQSGANQ